MNAVIVIDCTDKETVNISACKAFPETKEGNEEAEVLFKNWVIEASCNDDFNEDVTPIDEQNEILDNALSNGLYEVGEGYIAIMHTT